MYHCIVPERREKTFRSQISKVNTCEVPTSKCQEDQDLPSMGGAFERSQNFVARLVL